MDEVWKPIKDYEGLYEVSNFGKVKSLNYHRQNKEMILKPQHDTNGYLRVRLYKNEKWKTHKVHRLVAQAFVPNPNNLPMVNHKDEVKTNNNVNNLEWCTKQYNNRYGTKNQRHAEKLSKPILQFDKDGNFIKEYQSINEAARQLRISSGHICECCNEKHNHYHGFIWRYKEVGVND